MCGKSPTPDAVAYLHICIWAFASLLHFGNWNFLLFSWGLGIPKTFFNAQNISFRRNWS